MKKINILTKILIGLLLVVSVGFIGAKLENHKIQKSIDEMFTNSYHNLTLNMLNQTVEGISEDAIHRYNAENTKWSSIMINYYHLSSFYKYNNQDLDYIIAMLSQSSGYNAVSKLDMDLDLYHKIKEVPKDSFKSKEILKAAREAIENAVIEN
ncbi:MAG: hypothetical protein J6D15_03540 [Clostridia bacterium]|nr:hypothetical protein [Clostridia bacterium]